MLALAQQSTPGGGEVLDFLQYGLLGLFVVLLLTRQVITKGEKEEWRERAEKAEAEVSRLHRVMEEQVVPALSRSTDVLARYVEKKTGR